MYKKLNVENWERKKQFFFFKDYDNPFFNICTEVDVSELLNFTKENELSFFITSLYASIKAADLPHIVVPMHKLVFTVQALAI